MFPRPYRLRSHFNPFFAFSMETGSPTSRRWRSRSTFSSPGAFATASCVCSVRRPRFNRRRRLLRPRRHRRLPPRRRPHHLRRHRALTMKTVRSNTRALSRRPPRAGLRAPCRSTLRWSLRCASSAKQMLLLNQSVPLMRVFAVALHYQFQLCHSFAWLCATDRLGRVWRHAR